MDNQVRWLIHEMNAWSGDELDFGVMQTELGKFGISSFYPSENISEINLISDGENYKLELVFCQLHDSVQHVAHISLSARANYLLKYSKDYDAIVASNPDIYL